MLEDFDPGHNTKPGGSAALPFFERYFGPRSQFFLRMFQGLNIGHQSPSSAKGEQMKTFSKGFFKEIASQQTFLQEFIQVVKAQVQPRYLRTSEQFLNELFRTWQSRLKREKGNASELALRLSSEIEHRLKFKFPWSKLEIDFATNEVVQLLERSIRDYKEEQ